MRTSPTRIGLLTRLAMLTIPALLVGPAARGGGGANRPIPGGPGLIVFQSRIFTSGPTIFPINVVKPDGTGLTTLTTPNKGGYPKWSPLFADGSPRKIGWTDVDPATAKWCVAVADFIDSGPSLGPISYIAVPVDDLPSDGRIESMDWGVATPPQGGSQTIPVCFTVGGTFGGGYRAFIRLVNLSYAGGIFTATQFYNLDPGSGFSYFNARFSPNGRWLALERYDSAGGSAHQSIWLVDLNAQPPTASVLIDGPGSSNNTPAWSPDGNKLAFGSNRDRNQDIYYTNLNYDANGIPSAGAITRLTTSRNLAKVWPAWSPDGSQVAYMATSNSSLKIGKVLLGNTTEYSLADGGWLDWSP